MQGMKPRRNHFTGPLIAIALIITGVYVAGYFAMSEIQVLSVGEVRVFPSEAICNLYSPIHAIEQQITGRPAGHNY